MQQERAFLEAIRDDPGDDLHRLAWADWLDDHGQTRRADFVRAQVRAAALPPEDPARDALDDEADDLLAGHDAEWAGAVGERVLEWSWRRGCIERVTLWGDTFLTHGEELFGLAPVREVRLLTETGDMPVLAGSPLLSRLEAIDLGRTSPESFLVSAFQRDRAFQQLLVSPHLTRLKRLRLCGHGIEGPAIQTTIDTGLFARLEELDLADNRSLGDRAVRMMAAERSNTLGSLDVQGTNLTAFGLRHLLQARSWPSLRRLGVNAMVLFPRGLSAGGFEEEWARTPLTGQLTALRLSGSPVGVAALQGLLAWPGLAQLEELDLSNCRLDGGMAEMLAGCANLSGLRALNLGMNNLRDQGARAVASSPHLAKLAVLNLGSNGIGGPGIRAVANLAGLVELDLSGNYVGAAGAEILASGRLRRLRRLHLTDANVGPESAGALAGSPALGRVRVLRLGSNPLGDAGVAALARSPHLARLRELYLDSCGLDEPGAKALIESPHLGRVVRLGMRNTYISARLREAITLRYGPGSEF